MLTRRSVLTGTAAASIAAIASAHRAAAPATAAGNGFDCGFGTLEDGALGGFNKGPDSFRTFLKWHKAAVDVVFQELPGGGVEVFHKEFDKFDKWSPVNSFFLKITTLEGGEGSFDKFDKDRGVFFIKFVKLSIGVITTFENGEEGVQVSVDEVSLNSD